jgi:TetR/AcrR family transcriptional regulator, regulator of cefoperazone and chloramphenicol sensitivity
LLARFTSHACTREPYIGYRVLKLGAYFWVVFAIVFKAIDLEVPRSQYMRMVRISKRGSASPNIAGAEQAEDLDESKLRLVLAAESLFAERGIDTVSLREISAAAGQANNAAVQYHFGSKHGLITALTNFRVSQMEGPRASMLERAQQTGRLKDIFTLLEILCLPQLDLVNETGQHPYAQFMSQYISRYRPRGMPHASDFNTDKSTHLRRLGQLIFRRIDFLPPAIAQNRLELCNLMFNNALVRCDNDQLRVRDRMSFEVVVRDTIELAAAALCVPYRGDYDRSYSVSSWLETTVRPFQSESKEPGDIPRL